jgi:hypothetical protein
VEGIAMDRTKGPPAATFVVRLWQEQGEETERAWRGQIEHVQSGEREYVCEITQVIRFMERHFGDEASEARLGGIR